MKVAGAGPERESVSAEEQDVASVKEGVLCSVAVVYVPVDDQDAPAAEFDPCVRSCNGDVVEQTADASAMANGLRMAVIGLRVIRAAGPLC